MTAKPKYAGRVVSVNLSERKRVSKKPLPEAEFRPDHGLVGDAHAQPGERQVSLLALESIERQRRAFQAVGIRDRKKRPRAGAGKEGSGTLAVRSDSRKKGSGTLAVGSPTPFSEPCMPSLGPGSYAENVTTEGIPLAELPIGTRLRVGPAVVLEITKIGKECHTRCAIFQRLGDCVMPREGVFARVLEGGVVRSGDTVEVL